MNKAEVLKLAQLARIDISDEEAEELAGEFESILNYVSDIKNVVGKAEDKGLKPENFPLRNVLRPDENPHESGIYTKRILENAPARDGLPAQAGEYIKVKKIL